jgi:cellulose synthase/poly-beta-1,6-N-acetylglucosamine synthase-like glycosyltransferase
MWWILLLISIVLGILACPFFPFFSFYFFRNKEKDEEQLTEVNSFDVLIPCHNEKNRLRETLASIQCAKDEARKIFQKLSVNVFVGLDSCTDDTVSDADGYAVAIRSFSYSSKWRVLQELVHCSSADWVAFVDAGAIWDKRILRNALPYLCLENLSCFAPGYRVGTAGRVSRNLWLLEAFLKTIENKSGGPVSVHGATVFYRRESLVAVLKALSGRNWLNDDVALPLMLRVLFPLQKILYAANDAGGFVVTDSSPRQKSQEANARMRMVQGNLQWIRFLTPVAHRLSPHVLVVSLRRVFRLIWALPVTLFILALFSAAFEHAIVRGRILWPVVIFFFALSIALAIIKNPAFRASMHALLTISGRKSQLEDDFKWS